LWFAKQLALQYNPLAMTAEPTTAEKLRALPWSIASNAFLAIFVQLTYFGSVFVLFLDELGLSKGQVGLVLSLIPFASLLALFVAPAVARLGYKRTYITFFLARNLVTAGLVFTPLVLSQFGSRAALVFVIGVVATFAIFRAVGITGSFPWIQEYVPNAVRGKYTATNNFFSTLTGFLAIMTAGLVLNRTMDLTGYVVLIALGVLFGMVSVWLARRIPGGAPASAADAEERRQRDLATALRDSTLIRYLAGVGLFTLATVSLSSFLSLYMQDEVGLSSASVVRLQNGVLVGSLLSTYLWGWAADRYGSKPVIMYGSAMRALLPLGWMLMPKGTALSFPVAIGIAFMQGIADVGWTVGSARLLYNRVVPPDKRTDYLALYFAWVGIAGGFSQLIGGRLLDATSGLGGQFLFFDITPYTPLLLLGAILPIVAMVIFRRIQEDRALGMGEFAGLFLRGNPFLAMEAVVRFGRAGDEYAAVRVTERLGKAKSPLTVEELLEALDDPRFNVRFEALVSIARMAPDQRLIDALAEVLAGPEPALSTVAAWGLGRMGDPRAIEPLRQAAVASQYRSVRTHCIRALGVLGDRESIPGLLQGLEEETDLGLELAYSAALGRLQVTEATGRLLQLLDASPNHNTRQEMALDIARLVGDEGYFVQLWRQFREEPGTAAAQVLMNLKKRAAAFGPDHTDLVAALDRAAGALARGELDAGMAPLAEALRLVPPHHLAEHEHLIVADCADHLEADRAARLEYGVLALHTLHHAWAG
jgi:MFS family permease